MTPISSVSFKNNSHYYIPTIAHITSNHFTASPVWPRIALRDLGALPRARVHNHIRCIIHIRDKPYKIIVTKSGLFALYNAPYVELNPSQKFAVYMDFYKLNK